MSNIHNRPPKFRRFTKEPITASTDVLSVDDNIKKGILKDTLGDIPQYYQDIKFDYRFYDDVVGAKLHNELRSSKINLSGKLKSHNPLTHNYLNDGQTLPRNYSLRKYVTKVLNQGNLGACVAHSAVQAINIIMQTERNKLTVAKIDAPIIPASRGWLSSWWYRTPQIAPNLSAKLSTNLREFREGFYGSRLFVYDSARIEDGTSLLDDAGCTNLSACLGLTSWKVCDEIIWPYDESKFSIKPPTSAYDDAQKHTLFTYSIVEQDFTALCRAIASDHPVMFGIQVHSSMIRSGLNGGRGIVPMPRSDDSLMGGHSLLAVEYDLDQQTIGFVNHWGQWGDDGFGTIPSAYLEDSSLSGDFCAIEAFQ